MNRTINLQDHITDLVKEGRALTYQLETHFTSSLVHRLRVCIRRLRTMLDLVDSSSALPELSRMQMKNIWRTLGKVRDLDVGRELSEKYDIKADKIKAKRSSARKKLRSKLNDKKTQKLFDDLEKMGLKSSVAKIDPIPLLHELRMRLIHTPGDADHLHELRIVMKKIRYFSEALEYDVVPFKEFQDTLGDYHDLEVFREEHPDSLPVRKAFNTKKLKAMAIARSAVQLGLKALGHIENDFGRELAVRAS